MENHRKDQRHRTLKSGKIIVKTDTSLVDCMVRNLSDTGALLILPSLVGIPESFQLILGDQSRRDCRVAWRGKDRLGVNFVAA